MQHLYTYLKWSKMQLRKVSSVAYVRKNCLLCRPIVESSYRGQNYKSLIVLEITS